MGYSEEVGEVGFTNIVFQYRHYSHGQRLCRFSRQERVEERKEKGEIGYSVAPLCRCSCLLFGIIDSGNNVLD